MKTFKNFLKENYRTEFISKVVDMVFHVIKFFTIKLADMSEH